MYWKTLLEQRTAAGKLPVAVFTDIDNTFYRKDHGRRIAGTQFALE
ncbi:MAG: hypothetical protein AAB558_02390 [Patescibacteria group bacterium]